MIYTSIFYIQIYFFHFYPITSPNHTFSSLSRLLESVNYVVALSTAFISYEKREQVETSWRERGREMTDETYSEYK